MKNSKNNSKINTFEEELPHYAQYLNAEDIHNNYYYIEEETESEKELKEVGKNFNEDYFI